MVYLLDKKPEKGESHIEGYRSEKGISIQSIPPLSSLLNINVP